MRWISGAGFGMSWARAAPVAKRRAAAAARHGVVRFRTFIVFVLRSRLPRPRDRGGLRTHWRTYEPGRRRDFAVCGHALASRGHGRYRPCATPGASAQQAEAGRVRGRGGARRKIELDEDV